MSRAAMIVLVSLLAYTLVGLAISLIAAILWRTRAVAPAHLPPVARARRLLQLRLVPSIAAVAITLFVITPAFAIFEPSGGGEEVGPILKIVSVMASILIGVSMAGAARSLWLTRRLERQWLRASEPIAASRAAGLRAFAIQSPSPMVALVGVFEPKLIAARTVVDACTPEEIACIVAHERGHFDARDNLKRWIMASLPDVLRWTPIHDEIVKAWHHAAEDAADDAATGGHAVARAELAALLLKIVKLAPAPAWNAAVVSPFVEPHGLERRVRRLLQSEIEPPAPLAILPTIVVAIMAIAVVSATSSLATLERIFHALEKLVAFGR
jgi:beta-lactamase regulating signal transducer with metallopeptidase domain